MLRRCQHMCTGTKQYSDRVATLRGRLRWADMISVQGYCLGRLRSLNELAWPSCIYPVGTFAPRLHMSIFSLPLPGEFVPLARCSVSIPLGCPQLPLHFPLRSSLHLSVSFLLALLHAFSGKAVRSNVIEQADQSKGHVRECADSMVVAASRSPTAHI